MIQRGHWLTVVALLAMPCLFAQSNPTAQQKEVIDWVTRSLIDQQKHEWNDWSSATDRRVILLADQTIHFPTFAKDDYGLNYAMDSLKEERRDLYVQMHSVSVVNVGTWKWLTAASCGNEDEVLPQVKVVPARLLERTFKGENLDPSVALAIRISTPVISKDGTAAAVYAEAIGSHVENSRRQLILMTRKSGRPGEWDATIQEDRLLPPTVATPLDHEISAVDRATMTAALQWLVTKRGEFDLAGLNDISPRPEEWRWSQRETKSSFEISETALAQLSRRNSESIEFDTAQFSVSGVRNLTRDDDRIWSRPSVLVSLPGYDGDFAILSLMYRTADDPPKTAQYLVLLRRSGDRWSVAWTDVREGFIIS